jgi:hypothetical protein
LLESVIRNTALGSIEGVAPDLVSLSEITSAQIHTHILHSGLYLRRFTVFFFRKYRDAAVSNRQ